MAFPAAQVQQHLDYYSASSASDTLAPPSPEHEPLQLNDSSSTLSMAEHKRGSSSSSAYAALGQLSYAPATQTTVVTTTTTTTTSFPPLILRAPKHLYDRDPKQYPLAASPTPAAFKDFSFDVDGKPACFHEADDLEGSLLQFNQKQNSLQANNGTLRSITNSETQFETPKKLTEQRLATHKAMASRIAATTSGKKRSASPVSLAEAAEIASLQRQRKKVRSTLSETDGADTPEVYPNRQSRPRLSGVFDESAPATPDTDAGVTGQFKIPHAKSRTRKSGAKGVPHRGLPLGDRTDCSSERNGFGVSLAAGPLFPGVAATPPIAESDLEPAVPEDQLDDALPVPQQRRPTPLDTLTMQDASLPSPSLSPITAAATLSNSTFPPFANEKADEDEEEVSSLDIAQDSFRGRSRADIHKQRQHADLPTPLADTNPHSPTPTLMDIPTMLDSFDAMPSELQTYVMYQLLRRCAKPTLRMVGDVVNPALKCDFLDLLPLELSMNIISNFDVTTMCRAAQVSKKWRQIIDSDEKAWKTLLDDDEFVLPKGEVERAVKEGWGWQFPHGPDSYEKDLSSTHGATRAGSISSYHEGVLTYDAGSPPSVHLSRPKRKAAGKHSSHSNKKRKIKTPTLTKSRVVAPWMKSLERAQGPIAHANAAAMAIPNPEIGLASLSNLHLYKSIYRRHHAIRNGWMEEDTQPQHFAFRAHGRHVVTCLQFDTDKILTGSDDTKIHVYDTKTGALRSVLDGHEGGVWALQYEGNTLVSGSTDRSVRVWDIENGRCLQVFQGHTSTVRCLVILKPTKIGEEADGTPIIMPKEPLIITGSRDSSLRIWKLPQPGERSVMQTGPNANDSDNPYFLRALVGHHHSVRAIAAHGDTVVSGSYDTAVRVWKISDGQLLHRLNGHTAKVYSVVLDHERSRCISGSMDNAVKIWSLETGSMIHSLDGHTSLVGLLDLSHGRLVSAAADSTLRIWDPENGNCKSTLSAHTGAITCFQHDDQKVVSGSDRTVKMWNVKTGECVRDLLTDLSGVWQVKFNERRCVAAVQRDNWTYLEVLDFGAARDGVAKEQRGARTVVDQFGREIEDVTDTDDANIA